MSNKILSDSGEGLRASLASSAAEVSKNSPVRSDRHDFDELRKRVTSLSGSYLISSSDSLDFVAEQPTVLNSFKGFFNMRSETEKNNYRRGITQARRHVQLAYRNNEAVLSRFDKKFITPQKGLFFSTDSQYQQGSPLSADVLLRFIEEEEAIHSQNSVAAPVIEEKKLTVNEKVRIYHAARKPQLEAEAYFLELSKYSDVFEVESTESDWLAALYYGDDDFSIAIKNKDTRLELLSKELKSALDDAIIKRNQIEAKIDEAVNNGSWKDLNQLLKEAKPLPSIEEIRKKGDAINQAFEATLTLLVSDDSIRKAEKALRDYNYKGKDIYTYAYECEQLNNSLIAAKEKYKEVQKKISDAKEISDAARAVAQEAVASRALTIKSLAAAWSPLKTSTLHEAAKQKILLLHQVDQAALTIEEIKTERTKYCEQRKKESIDIYLYGENMDVLAKRDVALEETHMGSLNKRLEEAENAYKKLTSELDSNKYSEIRDDAQLKMIAAVNLFYRTIKETNEFLQRKKNAVVTAACQKIHPRVEPFDLSNEMKAKSDQELRSLVRDYDCESTSFSKVLCESAKKELERRQRTLIEQHPPVNDDSKRDV